MTPRMQHTMGASSVEYVLNELYVLSRRTLRDGPLFNVFTMKIIVSVHVGYNLLCDQETIITSSVILRP